MTEGNPANVFFSRCHSVLSQAYLCLIMPRCGGEVSPQSSVELWSCWERKKTPGPATQDSPGLSVPHKLKLQKRNKGQINNIKRTNRNHNGPVLLPQQGKEILRLGSSSVFTISPKSNMQLSFRSLTYPDLPSRHHVQAPPPGLVSQAKCWEISKSLISNVPVCL